MNRIWRVVSRSDELGNQLWSLQYDPLWATGSGGEPEAYGLWREHMVFRDESRALEHLREVEVEEFRC